ncbi:hypothetical protein GGI07_003364 [Coemansia sp. Benny D115]|nr:hypothetical protein GGI07_003364 [Coemansia sp. Benny D115]
MPRVQRTRQKSHAAPVVAHSSSATAKVDIVSAPVLLSDPAAEDPDSKQPKTKKAKREERHARWLNKLDTARSAQRNARKQEARAANPSALIRGMGAMSDSLREVRAEMATKYLLSLEAAANKPAVSQTKNKQQSGELNPKSRKARNKAAVREEKRFGQVLAHPAFRANPLETIRLHLANTLQQPETTATATDNN